MEPVSFINWIPFDNILYIGDEPKACINMMERFNDRIAEIEQNWLGWFSDQRHLSKLAKSDRLKYHIKYHFEGGMVIFKFRNADELPETIKHDCINACRTLAMEFYFNVC
jgi:hypothetical protein